MTRLSAIPDHHLSLECACGHHRLVPVADLPDPEATVAAVVARARCAACDRVGAVRHARIVYALKGESRACW